MAKFRFKNFSGLAKCLRFMMLNEKEAIEIVARFIQNNHNNLPGFNNFPSFTSEASDESEQECSSFKYENLNVDVNKIYGDCWLFQPKGKWFTEGKPNPGKLGHYLFYFLKFSQIPPIDLEIRTKSDYFYLMNGAHRLYLFYLLGKKLIPAKCLIPKT